MNFAAVPSPALPLDDSAVIYLREQFAIRKIKNPRYSSAAFAKLLGTSQGQLSRIFNGQRTLTHRLAKQFANALQLSPEAAQEFIERAILSAPPAAKVKQTLRAKTARSAVRKQQGQMTEFSVEDFKVASRWHDYALMELTFVEGFDGSAEYVSRHLGIPVFLAQSSIDRLLALGLLERCPRGRLKKAHPRIRIKNDKPEPELQQFYLSMLGKAKEELHRTSQQDFDLRLIEGVTFPVDPRRLDEVKSKIRAFFQELMISIQDHSFQDVYQCNVQLFPITAKERSKK